MVSASFRSLGGKKIVLPLTRWFFVRGVAMATVSGAPGVRES